MNAKDDLVLYAGTKRELRTRLLCEFFLLQSKCRIPPNDKLSTETIAETINNKNIYINEYLFGISGY